MPEKALNIYSPTSALKGIGPAKFSALKEIGIETLFDLINYFPRKYLDRTSITPIGSAKTGTEINLVGKVEAAGLVKGRKRSFFKAIISDKSGMITLIWFNGARFISKSIKVGDRLAVSGKVEFYNNLQIVHPEFDKLKENEDPLSSGIISPIYSIPAPLKANKIDNLFLKKIIRSLINEIETVPDYFSDKFRKEHSLILISEALKQIHFPSTSNALNNAINRLKFSEHFFFQLMMLSRKSLLDKLPSKPLIKTGVQTKLVYNTIDFELTKAQKRVLKQIKDDLSQPYAMNRLLQGDVGSGKTIIAILAAAISVSNKFQVAIMAPTEILANQHYKSFKKYADSAQISCALLVGGMPVGKRKKILTALKNHKIDMIVGTHALIQKDIEFSSLGLVIVDEQHRFGVNQRNTLVQKGVNPHLLSMTATPIPRTLAITYHGDMELSIIDELPKDRIPVVTKMVSEKRLNRVYSFMVDEVKSGRQCIIVYPLIEESEKSDLSAAIDMYNTLSENEFKDLRVGLLHGRQDKSEKEKIMQNFSENKINILLSTTVIEVGIDVPNATVMLIENAERFGLTQLHQLRGRVGRGNKKSYCILVQRKINEHSKKRLKIMESTNDGFKISDEDLKMRGPGEFFGIKQSGFFNFKIADLLLDGKMIKEARTAAETMLNNDIDTLRNTHDKIYSELISAYKDRLNQLLPKG